MKKFLYLRVNAVVAIVLALITGFYYITIARPNVFYTDFEWVGILLLLFAVPIIHPIHSLYVYKRYYPHTQLWRPHNIIDTILAIASLLVWIMYLFLAIQLWLSVMRGTIQLQIHLMAVLFTLLCVTTMTQVIGSLRLIKVIKRNARLELESSFS